MPLFTLRSLLSAMVPPAAEEQARTHLRKGAEAEAEPERSCTAGPPAEARHSVLRSVSPPSAVTGPVNPNQPPVLIIVEDDPDDFMLLKRALYKSGATARVWWARSAEEALGTLDELERGSVRLCVVMDLRMAGTDGWDLLARIKSRPLAHRIKCVLLTGMTDPHIPDRASLAGADACFTKPCDTAGLLDIARALQRLAVS